MRVLVIGVGTPSGDDAAGLAVAERLARCDLPEDARVVACERPLDLVDLFADAEAVIVVDALASGDAPGRLRWLDARELAACRGLSSHALGVAEALALAAALGRAPAHLELLGIGTCGVAGPAAGPGVRPAVAEAVAEAAERIRVRVEALAAPGAGGPPLRRPESSRLR